MAKIRIIKSGILALTRGPIADWVTQIGQRVERLASATAPRETGRTAASIKAARTTVRGYQVQVKIGTHSGIGLYPEEGTGIYGPTGRVIRPKSKPFLVFQPRGLGHVIRVKSVKGQPGQHYMRDALIAVIASLG